VGAYAVQLASHAGATVIATASGHDEAYLKSNRSQPRYRLSRGAIREGSAEKVDVVFDLIGGVPSSGRSSS